MKGNYYSLGDGSKAPQKMKKSLKGHYKMAFNRIFEDVTDLDMELRKKYGTELVSQYTKIPEDMLNFRSKTTNTTLSSSDEVYYVKKGKETIGKLSIRSQRTFRKNTLIVIYQEKKLKPVGINKTSKKSLTYTKNNSTIRRNKRQNKQKDNRTF